MELNPQTAVKVYQAIASAAHVADVTPSTGVDVRGFEELLVVINAGTYVGAASVLVRLSESSVVDGSGDAFATWTVPGASTFTAITTANDAAVIVGRVRLEGRKQFIRAVYDYTGNGTTEVAPAGVTFVLLGRRNTTLTNDTYDVNA